MIKSILVVKYYQKKERRISTMLDNLKNSWESFVRSLADGLWDVIFAVLILVVALIVAGLVKNLVIKGLRALKLEARLAKFNVDGGNMINLIAKIVWFVVFLLFLPAVFNKLGMNSITSPISNLVERMIGFVPNIIAAGILIAVGIVLGDIVAQLTHPLIKATKIDLLQAKVGIRATEKTTLSYIISIVLKALVIIFFSLQAIQALNLSVLNNVGQAIIGYIPAIISSMIIAAVAIFAAGAVEKLIIKANPKSKGLAFIVKIIVYTFAVFMILSQLGIAASIVNTAFRYVLAAICVAFAVAFGIGGRDFAKSMLAKFEKKIDDNER